MKKKLTEHIALSHRTNSFLHPTKSGRSKRIITSFKRTFRSLVIVTSLGMPFQSPAQQIRFDQLNISHGLSSNTVYSIHQDRHGRLWLGTLDGLNVYDGYDIVVYRHNLADSNSIPHNRITLIYEDSTGQRWFYDEYTSTLIRQDARGQRFKPYYLDKVAPGPTEISRIFEDRDGVLRLHSVNGYSLRFNQVENRFELEDTEVDYSPQNELLKFPALTAAFDQFLRSSRSQFTSKTIGAHKILRDHQGRYWLATHFDGLYTAIEHNGNFTFQSHLRAVNPSAQINSEDIYDLLEDRSNVMWIGTRNAGIYRYSHDKYKFNLIKSIASKEGLIELHAIRAIEVDRQKNIVVGTNNDGLIMVNADLTHGTHYLPTGNNGSHLAHRFVRSLWIDANEQLWVGQYTAISQFLPEKNAFKNFYPSHLHGEDIRIYDFKPDKNNGFWMAGWDHIIHFDTRTRAFSFVPRTATSPDFVNHNIRDLELTDEGNLWIAVGEKGVNIRNADGTFTTVHQSPTELNGLPSDNVFDVFRDSKNRIWLATADGLCQFNPQTFACETVTMNDGLPANMIYGIMEDRAGNFWLSSTRGLSKYNPESRTVRNFDMEDGLQSNEFTENAFFKDRDGMMYVGGIDGLNFFSPEEVPENRQAPIVSVTALKVFERSMTEVNLLNETDLRTKMENKETIVLNPNQRSISFEFVGIHYVNPQKNRYAHMLHNFETNWSYHDSNIRFANYTNLEPGTYVFSVKACNSDGHWSEPTQLTIIIEKPLYAATWFRVTGGILVLALGIAAYRLRIVALKKQQGLKASQLQMELNFLKNQVNPHFLFNTLNNIYALCQVNSRNAAPMVAKISDMMRYMLYDCKENRVPLDKEIEYLKNYIELNQLKSKKPLNVSFQHTGETHGIQIAPLLLINFLENSFKHGNLQFSENGFIDCRISVTRNALLFELRNSYQNHASFNDRNTKGIGLENVRHRLDLLYPKKHELTIRDDEGIFDVRLIIADI